MVNVVGEHSTQHLAYDAPLTADIEKFARPVSAWVRTVEAAGAIGEATSTAVAAAYGPPGRVATLIVPADFSWSEAGQPGSASPPARRALPDLARIRGAARALRSGRAALLLGGSTLQERGLRAAARLRAAGGVRGVAILGDRNTARMTRGRNVPGFERIPYFPEQAQRLLADFEHLILVEAKPPVSFFGYPGVRSTLAAPGCAFDVLAAIDEDGPGALEWLAEETGAPLETGAVELDRPEPPFGEALTAATIARAVAALAPEGTIVSEESVSASGEIWAHLGAAARYDHLPVTGGSIGQGLPVAIGAALASPGRKVVALEADGSAMYTPQSLWTLARERLDVVAVILSNRRYRILDLEMKRTGAGGMGPRAAQMIDLGKPPLNWLKLSEGFGVPAARATTADEFIAAFGAGMRAPGPRLIEAVLEP